MKRRRVSNLSSLCSGLFNHKPILESIVSFLPIISILSLKRALKLKDINGYNIAKDRYTRYLLSLGVAPLAIDILFRNEFEIAFTGSTVLKVLTDDSWMPGDIDLVVDKFTPAYSNFAHLPIIQTLYQNGCLLPQARDPTVYLKDIIDTTEYDSDRRNDFPQMLRCILEYNILDIYDPTLQVLHITGPIQKYVETFDFAFCRNYLSPKRLVIQNPIQLLKRECTVKNGKGERIQKYLERGYLINNTITSVE